MAMPILTYGSEVWVLRSWDESRIQAAEMRFLRAVKGCTRVDRIRNEEIRRQLSVMPLLGTLKEYRKRWSDHLMRMPLCMQTSFSSMEIQTEGEKRYRTPKKAMISEQANEPNP
ncbi:uncharacterized protein LOC142330650 [Lycorma delicatula]|uniref:uncharacterized protein LOC142330650 n=1 Tax=Lycorma delicatula TaxID=130591 RepID=UPI003F50E776